MIKKINNNKFLTNRLIPGLFFVIFIILFIFINRFILYDFNFYTNVDKTVFYILKTISFSILSGVFIWIFYELCNVFYKNKKLAIINAILLNITVFAGVKLPQDIFFNYNNFLFQYKSVGLLSEYLWKDYVFYILITVNWIYYLTTKYIYLKRNIVVDDFITQSLVFFLTFTILVIFLKSFLFFLVISNGIQYILLCFLVATISDTSGYIGGKFFGGKFFEKKLAPQISPKKTWEGFLFSFVITIFFIISFVFIYNTGNKNEINDFVNLLKTTKRTGFSLFILMSVLFAAIGDLYFSLIKRQLGIKDYSKLLKEHGGLLDRFDSISFVFLLLSLVVII